MTGLLEGKAAIVTGAGRGVGRAIAEALAAQGAKVIVADAGLSPSGEGADPSVARAAADAIGGNAIAFTESVASPGVARQLVDLAVTRFGRIDIVVNAATIRRDAPVFEADPADWDAVLRNNLSAPFYLINAATAVMLRRGIAGRIVNIVSGVPDAVAQAGLIALTHSTARDLAEERITANAVRSVDADRVPDVVIRLCTHDITGQVIP